VGDHRLALGFGLFSLLTARRFHRRLVTLRFLTGLGLGGAMPNVVSLASVRAEAPNHILVTDLRHG
jgi:hypothetical protein